MKYKATHMYVWVCLTLDQIIGPFRPALSAQTHGVSPGSLSSTREPLSENVRD